jgi:hypothetical protein
MSVWQKHLAAALAMMAAGNLKSSPNLIHAQDPLNDNPAYSAFNLELRPFVQMPPAAVTSFR